MLFTIDMKNKNFFLTTISNKATHDVNAEKIEIFLQVIIGANAGRSL